MAERGKEIFEAAGASEVLTEQRMKGSCWLGGIQMGSDPSRSVTDVYGRCHDVKNLFVAGPNLIPSAVEIQPTLTIVAMSLRTADFISDHRSEF